MKKIVTVILLSLFIFSTASFADNANLMHQSHEKLKEAQSQMEVIKKTEDPKDRKKLLDEHTETMQEFNEIILQIQIDPERGGAGQGTQMAELMHERVRYLEQMMQQLLENQSERSKIENK